MRAGRTTRDQAASAVEILRAVDAQIYGVVLNMVPTKGPDAYGYGYGYGYGAVRQQMSPDVPPREPRSLGRLLREGCLRRGVSDGSPTSLI